MDITDRLRWLDGKSYTNDDGEPRHLRLLPPLTAAQIDQLAAGLPCPLPDDIRRALLFSAGLSGTEHVDDRVDLSGLSQSGQWLEQFSPHAVSIACDGCGNSWSLDLWPQSREWGPVFYISHDPPVVVFQCATVEKFLEQLVRQPKESDLGAPLQAWVDRIWGQNPGLLTPAQAAHKDPVLAAFAAELGEPWEFVDLRQPALGDGFSWGRYGPDTQLKRHPEERIVAMKRPPARPSLWSRLFKR